MLRISDRSSTTCLVIEAEGAVTGEEYDAFLSTFEDILDQQGKVDLVVILTGPVSYGDSEAVKEDWHFAFKQYHHARRAAFVGEQHIINGMMRAFSTLTRVEERVFRSDQVDEAITWACAP